MDYLNYNDDYLNVIINKINQNGCLDEEIEQGYLEYKLRLDKIDNKSLKKLECQMLWRINEGKIMFNNYKAYYVLGIMDNGKFGNIENDNIEKSILILEKICDNAQLRIDYIFKYKYNNDKMIAIAIIKKSINKHLPEINLFLIGNSNTEKTTFLGNICYDTIDDMMGKSKLLIFKHKHEINSGFTSCIQHEIIGLKQNKDKINEVINYRNNTLDFNNSWDKIFHNSDILINIFDSPGNSKYLKTTFSSIFNINPDIFLIFTNLMDLKNDIKSILDKIKLILFLKKKFYIIFTEKDNLNECIFILQNSLINNNLFFNLTSINHFDKKIENNNIYYFSINNCDETTIIDFKFNFFTKVINTHLEYHNNNINKYNADTCFNINEIFDIPILNKNIILSGFLISGTIETNKIYYLNNIKIKIINIHNKTIDCDILYTGESGCLEIEFIENTKVNINKFMTIHNNPENIKLVDYINIEINKDDIDNINIKDDIYIYSKYFNNNFIIEDKIIKNNKIIIKVKSHNIGNISINKNNLLINDCCLIKFNDIHICGKISFIHHDL